jgi:hypothetical protein
VKASLWERPLVEIVHTLAKHYNNWVGFVFFFFSKFVRHTFYMYFVMCTFRLFISLRLMLHFHYFPSFAKKQKTKQNKTKKKKKKKKKTAQNSHHLSAIIHFWPVHRITEITTKYRNYRKCYRNYQWNDRNYLSIYSSVCQLITYQIL